MFQAFSKNGQDTITTADAQYQNIIGNSPTFSFEDLKLLSLLYNCPSKGKQI